MFRHEYRIEERESFMQNYLYGVQIRFWWMPIKWFSLKPSLFYNRKERRNLRMKDHIFWSVESAKEFAVEFATKGKAAFIERETTIYLGRLP